MAFLPLKLSSFFSCKDTLSIFFHSYVFYHFTCTGCKACYIGETKRHLNTRIEQHLGKDKKSHIYIHTSKKIHSGKKKLILIVLKLQIVLFLILGYKSRKQCILIGKSPSSTNRLSTQVLLSLYRSVGLLLYFFFSFSFIFSLLSLCVY